MNPLLRNSSRISFNIASSSSLQIQLTLSNNSSQQFLFQHQRPNRGLNQVWNAPVHSGTSYLVLHVLTTFLISANPI